MPLAAHLRVWKPWRCSAAGAGTPWGGRVGSEPLCAKLGSETAEPRDPPRLAEQRIFSIYMNAACVHGGDD